MRKVSLPLAAAMLLAACQVAQPRTPSPWTEPAAAAGSGPLYVLQLMSDPRSYPILRRHMGKYLAFIEQQVVPSPPADFTLDDFANVPAAGVSADDVEAIKRELAAIGWKP